MAEPTSPDRAARPPSAVCWRRLDVPGHDAARLARLGSGWLLDGAAVLAYRGAPVALRYTVTCDDAWRTVAGTVDGWIGGRDVRVAIRVDGERRWFVDEVEVAAVAGCDDVDYAFGPATNLLPIRRLALGVGDAAPVRAAWLRFPELTLEPLAQSYRRTAARTYRYASRGGAFQADLDVDEHELVRRYGDLWIAEEA